MSASVSALFRLKRSRLVPSATVGGRIATARIPASLRRDAAAKAATPVPMMAGPIWVADCRVSRPEAFNAWRSFAALAARRVRSDSEEGQTYYLVSTRTRVEYGFYYLTLIVFLAVMTHDVHELLTAARAAR